MEKTNFNEVMPLVTVYMPTHNRGALIRRAIDSVLNQTYKNLELIICSDGSTDETVDILQEYCDKDPRISYVVNETSQGACYSRNRCIERAKGEFITGLDDDDEFTANRIELFIERHLLEGRNILSASRLYRNDNETRVGDIFEGEITCEMLGSANLIGNQLFTKTEYIKSAGGFDTEFPAWQDYDMWYRLVSQFGSCYKLSEPTYIFYVDDNRPRITTGSRAYAGYRMFIEKHMSTLNNKQLKNLYFQDILNRSQPVTLQSLLKNITKTNFKIYLKEKLKKLSFAKKIHALVSRKRIFSKI